MTESILKSHRFGFDCHAEDSAAEPGIDSGQVGLQQPLGPCDDAMHHKSGGLSTILTDGKTARVATELLV